MRNEHSSQGPRPTRPHPHSARAVAMPQAGPSLTARIRLAGFGLLWVAVAATASGMVLVGDQWQPRAFSLGGVADAEPLTSVAAAAGAEGHAIAKLARATLLTLHDANRTGNYSVLHALAAPPFQAANPPEQLAGIFAPQRESGLDLSIAASEPPHWDAAPDIGADGFLRLKGSYHLPTEVLRFALMFAPGGQSAGHSGWRLIEIGVATEPKPGNGGRANVERGLPSP